jgi:hypothetical protein
MSQDIRRRLAARAERLSEDHLSKSRIGHSGGLDHEPADAPNRPHIACFSHGIDHSDGQSAQPSQPRAVCSRCPSGP